MYAVIESGGKQYRVEVGTELEVDLLDAEPGQEIKLERVLLVADGDESAIGTPVVADAAVSAEVVRQTRGEKLISFKYRPKARTRVKKGHRQELTILRITDVRLGKKSAADEKRQADAAGQDRAASASRRPAAKQAAADAELAAKLAKQSKAKADEKPATRAKSTAKAAPAAEKAPAKSRTRAKAADADATASTEGGGDESRPRRSPPAPRRTSNRDGPQESRFQLEERRDSVGQRLGVKAGDGQLVTAGVDHRPPARPDVPVRSGHRARS
jgi:large subunit ribosomal protein L21